MTPDEESSSAYEVTVLDQADADMEAAYNHLRPFVGDEKADQWLQGLLLTLFGLVDFPGPYAHPIDESASRSTETGSSPNAVSWRDRQKPIGAPYRVYYYTVKAEAENERSGIFILRVLPGCYQCYFKFY